MDLSMSTLPELPIVSKPIQEMESATVRFAGDSGDGMQVVGSQFTTASVIFGNDVSTLPDFPAEIRAPAGSLAGVSGFQINFSSQDVYTPGDQVDALFALNPAALKANIGDLRSGGLCILNEDTFNREGLEKAHYPSNPLEDGSLAAYRVITIPVTRLNREAVEGLGLDRKTADRCKNFFTLGLAYWLFDRPLKPTIQWITDKFGKKPDVKDANVRSLQAGYNYGDTAEMLAIGYRVNRAEIKPGKYRKITGNDGIAMGLIAASKLSNKSLFYGSYPITPASDILHELSSYKSFGVTTFQAEDEIAAICAALGAAFGGSLAVTGTSGPGLALKMEAIGLGVMTELPVVIIDVQRGGPSTGLPTKTEQSDLLQALFGRNGECPVPVLAASTPADCFETTLEACRIAMTYMTPVVLLSDGYIGNGAEPWRIPDIASLPRIDVPFYQGGNGQAFEPYRRDEHLSRPWAIPGTPGLEHRIGGLEKQNVTGNVSYDPDNHHAMVNLRRDKIQGIQNDVPPARVFGDQEGELLIVGWGSTYGAIQTAVEQVRRNHQPVSYVHLRYPHPFPANLGDLLKRYRKVLVPEMNLGQLRLLLRAHFLVDAQGLNKVKGRPFQVKEIVEKIEELLEN